MILKIDVLQAVQMELMLTVKIIHAQNVIITVRIVLGNIITALSA
jgi:hypothetical protein